MIRANWQQSADRFTRFFNRLTKARLAGTALAPALADAVMAELAAIDGVRDLPPPAAGVWAQFTAKYVDLPKPGMPPTADPLARLRASSEPEAQDAMELLGEVHNAISDAMRKGR